MSNLTWFEKYNEILHRLIVRDFIHLPAEMFSPVNLSVQPLAPAPSPQQRVQQDSFQSHSETDLEGRLNLEMGVLPVLLGVLLDVFLGVVLGAVLGVLLDVVLGAVLGAVVGVALGVRAHFERLELVDLCVLKMIWALEGGLRTLSYWLIMTLFLTFLSYEMWLFGRLNHFSLDHTKTCHH